MTAERPSQAYATSLLFGYFLRAVDFRFKLDKSFGTLPPAATKGAPADAKKKVRLFNLSVNVCTPAASC